MFIIMGTIKMHITDKWVNKIWYNHLMEYYYHKKAIKHDIFYNVDEY